MIATSPDRLPVRPRVMKGSVLVVPDIGNQISMFGRPERFNGLGTRLLDRGYLAVDAETVWEKIKKDNMLKMPVIKC